MNRLTIQSGATKGRRFSLRDSDIQVGSGADCTIQLEDPEVSDLHVRLVTRDGQVYLEPQPACPVLVNGNPATESTLQHGDELQIGATRLTFTVASLHAGMTVRRVGKMQRITVMAIILVLVLEGIYIVLLSSFRQDRSELEALRHAELAAATNASKEVEAAARSEDAGAPKLRIKGTDHTFAKDDQELFDICMIDLQFSGNRALTVDELDRIRVEGQFLEKVGTNEWTDPGGYMPSEPWSFVQDAKNERLFRSQSTMLLPRDPLYFRAETTIISEPVILGGTIKVFYEAELMDEKKIKIQLLERMNRLTPEV